MILKAADYPGISKDIDLDKVKDMSLYYKKICAFTGKVQPHQKLMKIDAIKIKKIIEENYPEYLI